MVNIDTHAHTQRKPLLKDSAETAGKNLTAKSQRKIFIVAGDVQLFITTIFVSR